jgi:MFS family permease
VTEGQTNEHQRGARMSAAASVEPPVATWAVCAVGAMGLAVAMGIGRFAFTPLLPLMQREALLTADAGAWLAAANYVGYLFGALTAARVPLAPRSLVLSALLGTAVMTAATGLVTGTAAWLVLRLLAGVVSAWALVGISSWALPALAQRGQSQAGGWVFAGVGAGVALAGAWVWWFAAHATTWLWVELGLLALLLAALVAWWWRPSAPTPGAWRGGSTGSPHTRGSVLPPRSWPLVWCYGMLGFGYILPATYLPALAREVIDDPQRFGLVWPVFGLAAAVSTVLAGRALRRWHRLRIWSASYGLMAVGCALPVLTHSGLSLTVAALLVGGTFMVATMAGLQHARAMAPDNPAPLLGRMSAAFASGQIAGPVVALALAPVLVHVPVAGLSGIELTLLLATACLLAAAAWLLQIPSEQETHGEHAPTAPSH